MSTLSLESRRSIVVIGLTLTVVVVVYHSFSAPLRNQASLLRLSLDECTAQGLLVEGHEESGDEFVVDGDKDRRDEELKGVQKVSSSAVDASAASIPFVAYKNMFWNNTLFRRALNQRPLWQHPPRRLHVLVLHTDPFMVQLQLHDDVAFRAWPISYAIPAAFLQGSSAKKNQGFATVIPGTDFNTHRNISSDWDDLSRSYYAITMKGRGGWDSMRHVEILSQGAVPYFTTGLSLIPPYTMYFFPREIVGALMKIPGVNVVARPVVDAVCCDQVLHASIDWAIFDHQLYSALRHWLHVHLTHSYTTTQMVKYMLRVTNNTRARRFLWIDDMLPASKPREPGMEWRGCGIGASVQHGLLSLFGETVSIVPAEPSYMYTDYPAHFDVPPFASLYARTLSRRRSEVVSSPKSVVDRIADQEFDVIIYGTSNDEIAWVEKKPYWETVTKFYHGNRLWYVDGSESDQDPHVRNPPKKLIRKITPFAKLGHTVFMREL